MAPIRKIQLATCFKKVRVPSEDNPSKTVTMWECCSPGDKGAVEKTWNDLDPLEIKETDVTIDDIVSACTAFRPSSSSDYIKKYTDWAVSGRSYQYIRF